MARTGENIYKRKDGRWEGRYIRFYDAYGKPKYGYVYAKTYSEVKQKLAERRCTNQPENAINGANVKYDDVLTMWLLSTQVSIKESTQAKYSQLVECHIRPKLGKYPLSKITTCVLESFIQQQLLDGRLDGNGGLAPKTVTDILTIIKETIAYAKDHSISVMCNPQKITIKGNNKEMRVLSPQEQQALVQVLLDEMDLSKFGILLALYTGIRIGELCALQWEDICLTTSTMKVRKTLQRIQDRRTDATAKTRVIITEPKSHCSIRDIPLPVFISELASQLKASPKSYILSGAENKYIEPRLLQRRFKRYISEAGVADANFHTTRHTFATRCVEVGFDIKTLSEILGHANVNITLNRYVHSSFELKRSNMSKLTFPP